MSEKVWWTSKTIAFNSLAGIAAALPLALSPEVPAPLPLMGGDQLLDAAGAALPTIEASLPLLRSVLPAEYYGWLAGVVVVGNIALRAISSARLVLKARQEAR